MKFILYVTFRRGKHTLSVEVEKVFDKIQHPLGCSQRMIKTLSKLEIGGNFLTLMKGNVQKPIANVIIDGEKLNAFPLILRKMQVRPLLPHLLNIILKVSAIRLGR